jgi:hypothetical protein
MNKYHYFETKIKLLTDKANNKPYALMYLKNSNSKSKNSKRSKSEWVAIDLFMVRPCPINHISCKTSCKALLMCDKKGVKGIITKKDMKVYIVRN